MSRARDFADLAGSAQGGGITGANALINPAIIIVLPAAVGAFITPLCFLSIVDIVLS